MYRVTWTDARMDDFAKHVDQRFESVERRLDKLDDRFASLQRALLIFHGGIMAALIGLIATQL